MGQPIVIFFWETVVFFWGNALVPMYPLMVKLVSLYRTCVPFLQVGIVRVHVHAASQESASPACGPESIMHDYSYEIRFSLKRKRYSYSSGIIVPLYDSHNWKIESFRIFYYKYICEQRYWLILNI